MDCKDRYSLTIGISKAPIHEGWSVCKKAERDGWTPPIFFLGYSYFENEMNKSFKTTCTSSTATYRIHNHQISIYIYNIEVNPPISVQTGYITHSISMIFPSYPHCLSGWSILNPRWGSPVTIVMSPTNPPVTTRGPVYQLCSSIPKSPSFVGSIMSKSQWITIFDVKIPWHPRFFPWFCARPPAGSQSMVGGAAAATTRRGFWMGRTCWKLQK